MHKMALGMFYEEENALNRFFHASRKHKKKFWCLTLNVIIDLFAWQHGTFKTEVIRDLTLTSKAQLLTSADTHSFLI